VKDLSGAAGRRREANEKEWLFMGRERLEELMPIKGA